MKTTLSPQLCLSVLKNCGLDVSALPRHLSLGVGGSVWQADQYVIKIHPNAHHDLFRCEALGLSCLMERGVLVPAVYAHSTDYIVMEYLTPGLDSHDRLGSMLARLHHNDKRTGYGWAAPVFLGALYVDGASSSADWKTFWLHQRIHPLLNQARAQLGHLNHRIDALLSSFEPPIEGACLIHGDLWSGNQLMSIKGPALIDPSVWRGERGVDLAMMKLFGGFPKSVWAAYESLYPIPKEVAEAIPYYQLYYLLAHVVLFGDSYIGGINTILTQYGI